jgi:hypothetical protein
VAWSISNHENFDAEFDALSEAVQDELLALLLLLEEQGPGLGRPHVDTLNGSKHANLKELRFKADDGVWRVAFAFDPERRAILLVARDKSGQQSGQFYKGLIAKADERYDRHLAQLGVKAKARSKAKAKSKSKAKAKAKERKHGKKSR